VLVSADGAAGGVVLVIVVVSAAALPASAEGVAACFGRVLGGCLMLNSGAWRESEVVGSALAKEADAGDIGGAPGVPSGDLRSRW
jgi:hypothetical protein